jgi:hypothetical protein
MKRIMSRSWVPPGGSMGPWFVVQVYFSDIANNSLACVANYTHKRDATFWSVTTYSCQLRS